MTYRFYILLLFDFVFDFQNKQIHFVRLNYVLTVLRKYLDESIYDSLKNIIFHLFLIGDFTLRLLKNIEKMILRKCVLSMSRVGQREKTNSALTSF